MNKSDLIDRVSATADTTKKATDAVITATLETIMDAIAEGDKVTLVGFGTFEARDRQAREGRNPGTGDPISIPATTVPGFSAGKLFKDRVAQSREIEQKAAA